MRKIRYFIFSFIFLIFSFVPCISAYAQGDVWTNSQKTQFFAEGFYKIVTDICGLILPTGLGGQNLQADYQTYVLNNNWIQNNMSYDDWIASQISGAYINGNSGNADITFSADLQNSLKEWAKDYIDNNLGFNYGYSRPVSSLLSYFNNQDNYHALLDFVSEHNNSLILFYIPNTGNPINIYEKPLDTDISLVKSSYDSTGLIYRTSSYTGWDKDNLNTFNYYMLNSSSHSYVLQSPTNNSNWNVVLDSVQKSNYIYSGNNYYLINQNSKQYQIYNSLNALKDSSEGVQDYYVTDSYNNTQVSETYTTTTNNIDNSITYGDVQNYVNNYYVENNSYPTTNIVYQYITNYVPSGNGGSGDDNGGGSGGNFDWSFLGTIGDFLGGLLQGLGNALSGILSLLTDIIDMFIGEDGLPNTISQLLGYFLNDFLPPEFLQLIELSIVLMVIIGVIKMIRG